MRRLLCSLVAAGIFLSCASADDAWEVGNPAPPSNLVKNSSQLLSLCAPRNVDIPTGRPIPTNAWWGNIVSCNGTNSSTTVWAQPLAVVVDSAGTGGGVYGFGVGYPYRTRFYGPASADGVVAYYAHSARKELTISAVDFQTTFPTTRVVDWTDLGVRVQMRLPSSSSSLIATLVRGMAYVTATFAGLVPRIVIEEPIQSINDVAATTGATITSSRFVVVTVTGKTWLVYAMSATGQSTTVAITMESNSAFRTASAFNGVLRVTPVTDTTQAAAHDSYSNCIVTGGTATVDSNDAYSFQWKTAGNCTKGVFNYALDHHTRTVTDASVVVVPGVSMGSTTHGMMTALVTRTSPPVWSFTEPGTIPISFYPRTRATTDDMSSLGMLANLVADVQATWSIAVDGSYYFNGKQAQKYASLCLMANDPAIVAQDASVLKRCVSKLEAIIVPFLTNGWTYKLMYDTVMGGIVSSESFVTGDLGSDFGNTGYNDHHYHYGYWVYTAAAINYLHPTWSRLSELNTMTRLLLRDVATPTSADPYFPKFRNFDWFQGHSYSHGLTLLADGKDQESTSEDINFVYAMSLFGAATGHDRMREIGNLMTKVTARATQTYFLMMNASDVHPASFRPHKVTGILFDNKVEYATWFCGTAECIHGIQMLPVTPVTEFARSKPFVQEEWTSVLSSVDKVVSGDMTEPWLSLFYLNYARVDKQTAISVLQQCALDDGLSRSWALYSASLFSQ